MLQCPPNGGNLAWDVALASIWNAASSLFCCALFFLVNIKDSLGMFPLDQNAPLSPKKISITTKSKILFLLASSTFDSVILEGRARLFSILPFSPFLSSIPFPFA